MFPNGAVFFNVAAGRFEDAMGRPLYKNGAGVGAASDPSTFKPDYSIQKGSKCDICCRELSSYLDAYHGKDALMVFFCAPCRYRYKKQR